MKKTREIDQVLGRNIIKYRSVSGKTRKELASAIGITHQQIQKYENGINRISVARLFDIAKVLNVPAMKLLDLETDLHSSSNDRNNKYISDIMKYINKIKDERKIDVIRNLVRSLALSEVPSESF